MIKIAAEVLGILEEHIALIETDTDATYYDNGSYASRETWVCGGAVKKAAEKIRTDLLGTAAVMLNRESAELKIRYSRISGTTGKAADLTVADVVQYAQRTYPSRDISAVESYSSPMDPGCYLANFAEVEVDTETGAVSVLTIAAVYNTGLGFALSEELRTDPVTGVVLNPSLRKYELFRAGDMPKIITAVIPDEEPGGPFGAKGLGEAATVCVAPAVVNAVSHAMDRDLSDLPVTPEKVLHSLHESEI